MSEAEGVFERPLACCPRVTDRTAIVFAGSHRRRCARCKHEIVISSQAYRTAVERGVEIICNDCGLRIMKPETATA